MNLVSDISRPKYESGRKPLRPIFALGAPMIGFFLIQTAVNVATIGMLGRLGSSVIAGVGAGSAIYTVICALLWGFDTGVQAVVARTTGSGRHSGIADVLAAAHFGALPFAVLLAILACAFGPQLVAIILHDHEASRVGGIWIEVAAPSILFLAVTLPINAAWIGSGRPLIATAVTVLSAPLQVALTFLFVLGAGPGRGMGSAGAALAMDATLLADVFVQVGLALWLVPGCMRVRPRAAKVFEIAAIGWPISSQQSLHQVALMLVFAVIAQLGTGPAAIVSVLLTLTAIPTQTGTALGVVAATLVGQALGAGRPNEARRCGWLTTTLTIALTLPMGLALSLSPHLLLATFLHNPSTLTMAILPARIVGLGVSINAAAIVLGYAYRGAGATKTAAIVPFVSLWFLQLPLMAWIGIILKQGLVGVVCVQTGIVTADVLALALIWASGAWLRVPIDTGGGPGAAPFKPFDFTLWPEVRA